jgi:hypothetical protein
MLLLSSIGVQAGGGLVLEDDVCIVRIDFYSAHFTAYQPDSRGNEQFCDELPDTGVTLFVLDYLHQSLKEVPVGLRIIRDVTGQGQYVKLKHVEAIDDLDEHTVHYQPPVVEKDASLKVEFNIPEKGSYLGIVSAGHPSTDAVYVAVFPFEAGAPGNGFLITAGLLVTAALALFLRRRRHTARSGTAEKEQGT